MPFTRLLLLLIVLIGLSVFAWQNWSLPLTVVFLGMHSQALPLSAWILMAIAVGALTSGVLQLLGYLSKRSLIARIRQLEAGDFPPTDEERQDPQTTDSRVDNSSDDWDDEEELGSTSAQDWEESEQRSTSASSSENVSQNTANYEARQEPTSSSRAGSVYSYSYKKPSDSGVGKTEVIYDVNYRVINPPSQEPVDKENLDDWESKNADDEDWGFDDDEFEDEDRRDRSSRRS